MNSLSEGQTVVYTGETDGCLTNGRRYIVRYIGDDDEFVVEGDCGWDHTVNDDEFEIATRICLFEKT